MDDLPEIAVRRSTRARRARLVVRPPGQVEVVLPARAPARLAGELVASHRDWLARTLRRQAEQAARTPPLGLDRPGVGWLAGEPVEPARVLGRAQDPLAGYRALARRRLGGLLAAEGARLDTRPARLAIRDARTRWGSCSSKGTISLSWRLVLAPPEVARYVVVHELCHLRRLDHSPAFWTLLEAALPGWREPHGWLRRHGAELSSYDPALVLAAP